VSSSTIKNKQTNKKKKVQANQINRTRVLPSAAAIARTRSMSTDAGGSGGVGVERVELAADPLSCGRLEIICESNSMATVPYFLFFYFLF